MDKGMKALRPADAAFLCFVSTTLVFSPNTSIFRGTGSGAFIGWFVYAMFGGLIAAALATAVTAYRAPGRRLPRWAHVLAAALYTAGCVIFGVFSLAGVEGGALPALAGAACGAAFMPVCVSWARRLARLDFRTALAASCIACVGAALLTSALTYLPAAPKTALYAAFVLVGAFAPLPAAAPDATDPGDAAPQPAAGASSGLLRTLRLPAAGLLLYAFMMAISKSQAFGLFDSEFVGGVVAALCIVPLFAIRTKASLPSLVYRIIVPAIGGLAVVLFSLPADLGLADVALSVVYVFLSALAILALANLIAVMNAGEFDCALVTGTASAAAGAVSLAGLALANATGMQADFTPAIFVMVALCVAFLLVSLGADSWRMVNRLDDRADAAPAAEDRPARPNRAERPDALAWLSPEQHASLTKREREILAYCCRGHSVIYIAEKLFISESTVRTHVKHIYAKLGIHSREELLEAATR